MEQEKQSVYYEEEVDLIDYLKVIFKRKFLILVVLLGAVILAGVFSFLMPKVYKIDTTLEVGQIEGKVIENMGELVGKIRSDVYGMTIRKKLEISEKDYPKVTVENPKNTNLLNLKIESPNSELAKNILTEFNNLILKELRGKLEKQKESLEKETERLKNKVDSLKEEKRIIETELDIFQKALLKEQSLALQFAFFATQEKLENKKQEIENLSSQISSLERVLKSVQSSGVIKVPTVSPEPIRPKPVLNMVIGAILGLFVGIFLAFLKEWWELNKENIDKSI